MNFTNEIWEKYNKRVPELLGITSKIGFLVGAGCIVIYSLMIGNYPKELTLGDGLLFLITAFVAGMYALIFIVSLLCLGIFLSPILKIIFRAIIIISNKYFNENLTIHYDLIRFDWLALVGSLYSLVIMLTLAQKNSLVLFSFPLLSILVYIFFSLFLSCRKKIQALQCQTIELFSNNGKNPSKEKEVNKFRQIQKLSAFMVLVIPFLLGGVNSQLLQGTMRMIHIRTEAATIFLAEPYSTILSNPLVAELPIESKVWKRFDDVTILSAGYGKFSVISKGSEKDAIKLEVPNDKIIVKQNTSLRSFRF